MKKFMIELVTLCKSAPDKNCINYGTDEFYFDTFKEAQAEYEICKKRTSEGYGVVMHRYNEETEEYECKKDFMSYYQ